MTNEQMVPVASHAYKRIVIDGDRFYGKHVVLSAVACNTSLLDIEAVRQFVRELVDRIDMVAYGETFVARFGSGIETGISAVQLIETSAISLHTNDGARDLYLDVFSCKDFRAEDVVGAVHDHFAPERIDHQVLFRR
jgi:S-adenosylmethionine decarboxylase